MMSYAMLGPIAGSIAAAFMAVTGAAQIAQAKAERDRIKNMQPGKTAGNSASGASSPKAERKLTGYSEGGYTGDGDRYEVAGLVHKGEYVVPKPIMDNPRVIDAVGVIESIRRRNGSSQAAFRNDDMPGYADGGYTSGAYAQDSAGIAESLKELKDALNSFKTLKAYVVYSDIEKAGETMDRAREPFTRNK